MPESSDRLDVAMSRRRLELGLTWRQLAEVAGISYETLRAIRKGDNRPKEDTQWSLEKALRWEPGSVDAVMNGGAPTPVAQLDVGLPDDDPRVKALVAILETLTPDEQREAIRRYQERLERRERFPSRERNTG